jgi:hypothetical protein
MTRRQLAALVGVVPGILVAVFMFLFMALAAVATTWDAFGGVEDGGPVALAVRWIAFSVAACLAALYIAQFGNRRASLLETAWGVVGAAAIPFIVVLVSLGPF